MWFIFRYFQEDAVADIDLGDAASDQIVELAVDKFGAIGITK